MKNENRSFNEITPLKSFSSWDVFSDEEGTINPALPKSLWTVEFSETSNSTMVSIKTKFDELSDLEKMLEMGFKEGITAGLENLYELLNSE